MPDVIYEQRSTKSSEAAAGAIAGAGVLNTAIEKAGGIIEWLLKASVSSPILAATSGIIIVDILAKNNVITKNAQLLANDLIIATMAVDLTGTIITDIVDVLPFTAPKINMAAGSAQVVVFGEGSSQNTQLIPLLQLLASKT